MLPQLLYPQGNFLNIKDTASSPTDYNIRVTKDLVENLPGGVVKDVFAPALAASLSLPYDAIQASTRTTESDIGRAMQTGALTPRDIASEAFGLAYDRENPLSTAIERTIGASGPLAERLSNNNRTLTVNDLIGLNYSNLRNPITPRQDMNRNQPFLNSSYPQAEFLPNNQQGSLNVDMGATGNIPMAANINTQPLVGEMSGIAPMLTSNNDMPLYEDFEKITKSNKVVEPKKRNLKGLKQILGFLVGAGLDLPVNLLTYGSQALSGLRSLNQRIRNTDFAQATSLADYFDMKRYGGAQGRRDAAARTMAQARGIQKQMAQRPSSKVSAQDANRGQINTPSRTKSSGPRQSRQTSGIGGLHSGY